MFGHVKEPVLMLSTIKFHIFVWNMLGIENGWFRTLLFTFFLFRFFEYIFSVKSRTHNMWQYQKLLERTGITPWLGFRTLVDSLLTYYTRAQEFKLRIWYIKRKRTMKKKIHLNKCPFSYLLSKAGAIK